MPAYYLSEINQRCRRDAAQFIADCDAIYAGRLELAADRIMENMSRSPIVLLSGPSGSGKTTTAMKICEVLESQGIHTHTISMDDYFKTVDPLTTPRTPEGSYDLESPLCMDMDLLNEHFTLLSQGKTVNVPKSKFPRQTRVMRPGRELRLGDRDVAIFEGIHALNDTITNVHPEAFKLYISARSNILDDGGKVVFLLIEGITGHPVPEKLQGGLTVATFALLFGLMIFATFNDILRLFTGAV